MKKYISNFAVLLILFLSVPILTSLYSTRVYAATSAPVTAAPQAVPDRLTPTPTPARVEYVLPYPGILPDNPFYMLKNLRDTIIELLISDPVNKAEFYMLQADKKLSMALMLAGIGKPIQSQDVLNQALDMRTKAVTKLEQLTQSGKQVPMYVIEKLNLSLKKHHEVLIDMKQPVDAITSLLSRAVALVQQTK